MARSGPIDLGNIIPSFDTGSNSIPFLDKAFETFSGQLDKIAELLQKGGLLKG